MSAPTCAGFYNTSFVIIQFIMIIRLRKRDSDMLLLLLIRMLMLLLHMIVFLNHQAGPLWPTGRMFDGPVVNYLCFNFSYHFVTL